MFENAICRRLLRGALLLCFAIPTFAAQDGELQEIKYQEDYDRIQKIVKVGDVVKRSDQILALYKERPDIDPKLRQYIDGILARDMETMLKQGNSSGVISIGDRAVKLRPHFGEVYFFQGLALKSAKRFDEAATAFAKCYVVNNPYKTRAKPQLDSAYRAAHNGSLVGEDKLISRAARELR